MHHLLKKDEAQSDTCCINYLPLSNCLPTLLGEGSCHPCLDLKGLNRKGGNGAVGEEVTFWGDGSGASASTGLHLPTDVKTAAGYIPASTEEGWMGWEEGLFGE